MSMHQGVMKGKGHLGQWEQPEFGTEASVTHRPEQLDGCKGKHI